jgi:16S rRNA G527 N7-methylase RsmG
MNKKLESGDIEVKLIIREQQMHLQNYVAELVKKNKAIELLKVHLVQNRRN